MALTIYKASAGAGKTHTLVGEYIQMLFEERDDNAYRRILAVTFTHKATNEMKQRVIVQLYKLAKGEDSPYRKDLQTKFKFTAQEVNHKALRLLRHILQDYSSFSISTIDSFFQRIVRAFAREIGLSGSYSVRLDTEALLQQAIDTMFSDLKKDSDLFKWLVQYTRENIQEGKSWNIKGDIEKLGKQLFTEQYLRNATEGNRVDKQQLNAYKEALTAKKNLLHNQLKAKAQAGLDLLKNAKLEISNFKNGNRSPMGLLNEWANGRLKQPTKTFNALCEGSDQCYAKSASQAIKNTIDGIYPTLQPILIDLLTWWQQDAYKDYETCSTMLQHLNTVGILGDIDQQLRSLVKEQNILPISDTNVLLNRIIGESDTPFVYEKIGTRYKHYMLDEFQDTSNMQWDNFRPLIQESVSNGHRNLVVGDVKQSIYRWRNSDWTLLNTQICKDINTASNLTLPHNYRSTQEIVMFNNDFFKNAVQVISKRLMEDYTGCELEKTLATAYETIEQIPKPKDGIKGFVEIAQQHKEDKQNYQTWATDLTLQYIKELQQAGVPLHDITILVRRNKEAQLLSSTLLDEGYRVVSNEGLCINNAVTVRFLVNLLLLQLDPDINILHTIVNYYYLRSRAENANTAIQQATQAGKKLLFTEEEIQKYHELKTLSLCDRVQQFIGLFRLGQVEGEEMFLQCFLDSIFQYVNENNADTRGFLEWWDKNGKTKTVPCPTMDNAINVMTIHQSKGLEFEYVIIPFVWDIKVMMGDILWCQNPEKTDANQPNILPISSKENLIHTKFADTYLTEKLNIFIDNLNLMYVAFTRAIKGLYCLTPYKEEGKINSTAHIINAYLKKEQALLCNTELYTRYQVGEKHSAQQKETTQTPIHTESLGFHYNALTNRIKIKDTFVPHQLGKSLQEDRRRWGIIMHDILKNVQYEEDFHTAVAMALAEGKICEEEKPLIEKELERFKALVGNRDWFDKQYIIHNEASILLPNGLTKRPDRLMINPKEKNAIVVDYKFGDKMEDKYINQIKEYKQYIIDMGYQCQAYICYVEIGEIITA